MALFDMGSRSERDTDEGDQRGASHAGFGRPCEMVTRTVTLP